MATLILTAVGTVLGGPIGGALGAIAGGQIDRAVLAPKSRREGPRLSELRVQTSSYGSQIPRLFGTLRVAGTVIWSTDLIESRASARAGKGQPTTTTYSYSASFAVLLSGRPIADVRRIWADGNLLRGAAGDLKAQTAFRLHRGGEDQAVDPLIASAVGAGLAPAHRGCAYAVFEGLQLADFGNRIPSLTFEVIADEGGVSVGTIAAALAPELDGAAATPLAGFAATGGSTRAVLETLREASGARFVPMGARLAMRDDRSSEAVVDDRAVTAADRAVRRTRTVAAIETVPRTVLLSYYDPARDYQAGLQRAVRPGAGEREDRIEMAAVLDADAAKAMALAALARAEAGRTRRTLTAFLDALTVSPGTIVSVAGEAGSWIVSDTNVEQFVVRLTLRPLAPDLAAGAGARGVPCVAPDRIVGATLLHAAELPPLGDAALVAPRIVVAANGAGEGWRQAALLVSLDGGASWTAAGGTAAPATVGAVVAPPSAAPAELIDRRSTCIVRLARSDLMLADADLDRLDAGANLALIGDELIQFGRAEPLGGSGWRLSELLRGRRGTEAAIAGHAAGERFMLLADDTLRAIDLPLTAVGGTARIMASGVGDADPVTIDVPVTGASILPPSPVHFVAGPAAGGKRDLSWVRRSRNGWHWTDGGDVPLVEEQEAYRLTLIDAHGDVRSIECPTAAARIDAGMQMEVQVAQRGTFATSKSTRL